MKIETKYDIGQKVWRIREKAVFQKCKACGGRDQGVFRWDIIGKATKIALVCVYGSSKEDIEERYEFRGYGQVYSWDGEDVFRTKAEAQAECDKRNNGVRN